MLVDGVAVIFDWYHLLGMPVCELTIDYRLVGTRKWSTDADIISQLVVFVPVLTVSHQI